MTANGDDELRGRLAGIEREVERMLGDTGAGGEDERRRVASAVQGLLDAVSTSGPLAEALRPFLDQLRALARWLEDPSAERTADARDGLASIRAAFGTLVPMPVEENDEQRRARIKVEVRASLDKIFGRR